MMIEIEKLETISNFAKRKNMSRQHIYRLAENNEITLILIDSIAFIYLDNKAINYERKRKIKKNT